MKSVPALNHVQITEHVIQIGDSAGNACTLVTGSERAVLFDTMTGACDLKRYVEGLTDLPLTVILSHGHFDHSYGSWQFGRVFLNPREKTVYYANRELLPEIIRNTGSVLPAELVSGDFELSFSDLNEGDRFDLGGITAEAVSLPGHTEGSTGLLLKEEEILLVGDAVSPQMTLIFNESLPVPVYLETLGKVRNLPVRSIIGSHFMKAFPISVTETFADCAKSIGKIRGMKYMFTPVPEYRGILWLYRINEPVTGETVCIITKEDAQAEFSR